MKKGLCYLCCLALLTACESNSDPEMERGESVPLAVKELSLTGEAATRVAPGAVSIDGAAIGVFLTDQNGYTPAYNCVYAYSSAKGGWTSEAPVWVDKREAKIVGVYDPGNVGAFPASNTGFVSSTNLTAQAYDENKLWYFDNNSNTAINNTNAAVAFKMKPVYSRMTLEIARDASYHSDCKITEVTLLSGGVFYNDLPLDVSTATLQGSATAYNADTKPLLTKAEGFVTIPSGSTQSIDLLLPPQAVQNTGLVLSIKVDGQVRSVTIPYASLPKLDAAIQYNVPLKIMNPATLTVSSNVTEGAWTATSAMNTVTDISKKN